MAKLVNSDIVVQVSRTARPFVILDWPLTFDELLRRTSGMKGWRGTFEELTATEAARIAKEINIEAPWRNEPVIFVEGQPRVIEGKLAEQRTPLGVAARMAIKGS